MDLTPEATKVAIPEEHTKVRTKREVPYKDMTHAEAKKFLEDRGFVLDKDRTQQFQTAEVYHYTNPHTKQRANLSHKSQDKRGRPVDEAKVNFHLVVQPKRRTPDQKIRDERTSLYD